MVFFWKRQPKERVISAKAKVRDAFLKNFQNYVRRFPKVVIFIHENPDGDCIGGAFGLKEVLKNSFKEKEVYVVGESQGAFPWLHMPFDTLKEDFDFSQSLAIIIDASAGNRVQLFDQYFKDLGVRRWGAVIRIDHHESSIDSIYSDLSWADSSYAACCAQLVQICDFYQWKMNCKAATYFYLGIMTDSGFFANSEVSPRTLVLAAKALRAGADREFIVNNLRRITVPEIKMREHILSNYTQDEGFVWYFMDKPTIEKFAPYSNGGNVGVLAHIEDNVLWMMFTEQEEGTIRASIRSVGTLNVRKLAEEFSGGGHMNAAGATLIDKTKMNELIDRAREYVKEFLDASQFTSKEAECNVAEEKYDEATNPPYRLELTPEEQVDLQASEDVLKEIQESLEKQAQIGDLEQLSEEDIDLEKILASENDPKLFGDIDQQEPLAEQPKDPEEVVKEDHVELPAPEEEESKTEKKSRRKKKDVS
ncbi:MgpA-like protein, DHH family phosphoesterase [Candidatus Mycoplasma haematolamae str. Purdue]|uniref:MgpA-like protein, DHH family phosphoesterase n=1 Tax=Mycoplasma haematolamae (strain Purdue) TaxID=1212765 RepID=I7B8T0_MYCHA|nr:bifunctional oligoribonuclease/PAP phosphatase NrnA [Candidatus Mycoplasma haematolamae]AFO51640.1 MgpA-like protein, DHH family phosphoesterase [Candidatus Mycoplasma haematolamae str. Purdue]